MYSRLAGKRECVFLARPHFQWADGAQNCFPEHPESSLQTEPVSNTESYDFVRLIR
ncbi:MAG: hypothetical protein Fues2KO_46560 [Fuerstiella sp.]